MEICGYGSEFKPKGDTKHIDMELVKKLIQGMLQENLNESFGQPIHKMVCFVEIYFTYNTIQPLKVFNGFQNTHYCATIDTINFTLSKVQKNLPAKQTQRSRRCRFHPWVGKVPWRKSWQPTPVFLPGDFPGGATVHSVTKSQIQLKRLCTAQHLPVLDISYKQNHAICDLS